MTTHPQAALLHALSAHLDQHPNLSEIDISENGGIQLTAYPPKPVDGARMLLAWAETITEPTITISRIDSQSGPVWTKVEARGSINNVPVRIWSAEYGDLHKWIDPEHWRNQIPLDQLDAYVTAGTVDGVA